MLTLIRFFLKKMGEVIPLTSSRHIAVVFTFFSPIITWYRINRWERQMCFPTVTHLREEQVIKRPRWLNSHLSNNQKRQEMPDLKCYINSCTLSTYAHMLFCRFIKISELYLAAWVLTQGGVMTPQAFLLALFMQCSNSLCLRLCPSSFVQYRRGPWKSHRPGPQVSVSLTGPKLYGGSLSHWSSSPGWWSCQNPTFTSTMVFYGF